MRGPNRHIVLAALLAVAAAARAQEPTAADVPSPPEDSGVLPPDETLVAIREADSRILVPVRVNGTGPWPFIVDTGAQRTVLARDLARSLALRPGKPVKLASMATIKTVGTVRVADLVIETLGGSIALEAPMLDRRYLGAAGLLGLDTLQKHAVRLDLDAGTMAVRPSRGRKRKRPEPNEVVVSAKSRYGQLIVTRARLGNIPIQVVIDTGAQVTVGNQALQRRIGSRHGLSVPIQLTSVTGERMLAQYTSVGDVKIGRVTFQQMPVAFADAAPFKHFDLQKTPAILLGMDVLRGFRRVEIDFGRKEVRFLVPRTRRP